MTAFGKHVLSMLSLSLFLLGAGATTAMAEDNNGGDVSLQGIEAQVILATPSRGVPFCTAAINSNGTVATCFNCNTSATQTRRLGVGIYEVDFIRSCADARANSGIARFVQVDTLGTGTSNAYCTTADRAGDASSVFVDCRNNTGARVDAAFYMMLTR